jgi:pimeloyl-ACP methyl ester carboxylesterase
MAEPRAPVRTVRLPGLSPTGLHRFAVHEWQGRGEAPVVCVHGLTRNGRDFDFLAGVLADRGRRVLAPDVVGRGQSDWLVDPNAYHHTQYVQDMMGVFGLAGGGPVDWIGTSMGGMIGLALAADPKTPIRRLVLNDIGPFIPKTALEPIRDGLGDPRFDSDDALRAALKEGAAGWGDLPEAVWDHMVVHQARRRKDGSLGRAYDPAIAVPQRARPLEDVDLWALWDRVRVPVLVLRGESSPILTPETAARMAEGENVIVMEIPGCAHAPSLMVDDQIALVADWLDAR